VFGATESFAQSHKKKNKKPVILSLGAGVSGGDYSGISSVGPYIYFDIRKTAIRLNKYMNFSYDFNIGPQASFFKGQYIAGTATAVYPAAQFTFNFNAMQGATPPSKKGGIKFPVGVFLGPGLYMAAGTYGSVISTLSGDIYNKTPKKMSMVDLGPMVNFGFRIKLSKKYFFGLRFYGAFTVVNEVAIGGGGLVFPVNLKKYANAR
jgi:hypothetical protein